MGDIVKVLGSGGVVWEMTVPTDPMARARFDLKIANGELMVVEEPAKAPATKKAAPKADAPTTES
jgi:hypothetical protein